MLEKSGGDGVDGEKKEREGRSTWAEADRGEMRRPSLGCRHLSVG